MGEKVVVLDAHQISDNRINKQIDSVRTRYPVFRINVNFYRRTETLDKDRGMVLDYSPSENPYLNGAAFAMSTAAGLWPRRVASLLRRNFISEGDKTIIHVHDPYLLGLAAGVSRQFGGAPIVYDRHEYFETWKNSLGFSAPGLFESFFGRKVSEVIFVSRRIESLPNVFKDLPVSVIPNYPISTAFNHEAVQDKISRFDGGEIVASYFGVLNLNFDRDIEQMFQVMAKVMDADGRFRFIVAGRIYDEGIRKTMEDMASRSGGRMSYLGEISFREVLERTISSHLGFFLLRPESPMWCTDRPVSPNKVYEYLLSGTIPIVKAVLDDHESIDEVALTFGASATADDISEGILKLASDPERMRELMSKCSGLATRFTWEGVSHHYIESYRRLFDSLTE